MAEQSAQAPSCDVDFYGTATLADPARAYHAMLALGPVVWLPRNNLHAVVGHAAVTQCLRDHRVFRSGRGVSINEEVNTFLRGSTLNSDPPEHDATRSITFAPLTPKALEGVRARIVAEAEFIADKTVSRGRFDAARELAPHIPLKIVRDLVGLGPHGEAHMLDWGAATFELMGDPRERRQAAQDRMAALRDFLDDPATIKQLSAGGWAQEATRRGQAAGMAHDHAIRLMRDYIAPSLDTTISAIGYAVLLFARNPDQWDMLRADRSLMRNAVEEIVRLSTPIRAFSRYVEEEVVIEGVNLAQGSRVLIVYGAANRDPARFDAPDRFDISRDLRGHVGFGHGVHACLGMHLARLEMSCLFDALADRVARFEVDGPVRMAENATIHALSELPVRVDRCAPDIAHPGQLG